MVPHRHGPHVRSLRGVGCGRYVRRAGSPKLIKPPLQRMVEARAPASLLQPDIVLLLAARLQRPRPILARQVRVPLKESTQRHRRRGGGRHRDISQRDTRARGQGVGRAAIPDRAVGRAAIGLLKKEKKAAGRGSLSHHTGPDQTRRWGPDPLNCLAGRWQCASSRRARSLYNFSPLLPASADFGSEPAQLDPLCVFWIPS